MDFNAWKNKEFGKQGAKATKAAASFLGFEVRTVKAWLRFERFPRLQAQQTIKEKSGGQVDVEAWRKEYLEKNTKGVACK